ncbi:hypothetical protein GCM10022267_31370 [Lentzea roselyniae]|uniref:Uncharacterized protein n=1 Tax=Lentzea roselyniae TaxID=531940 RepID=A0ABP7AWP4_9PSEU
MPQGVLLDMPSRHRVSDDVGRARREHLAWPIKFGLITTAKQAHCHLGADFADIGAQLHPHAQGPDLDLGVDQLSWMILFDDLFDGPRGDDPAQARTLTDAVADTSTDPDNTSGIPIAEAFADYGSAAKTACPRPDGTATPKRGGSTWLLTSARPPAATPAFPVPWMTVSSRVVSLPVCTPWSTWPIRKHDAGAVDLHRRPRHVIHGHVPESALFTPPEESL